MGISFNSDKIDIQKNAHAVLDLSPLSDQKLVKGISGLLPPLRTAAVATRELDEEIKAIQFDTSALESIKAEGVIRMRIQDVAES